MALEAVAENHVTIFKNCDNLCNIDKTAITIDATAKEKVFSSSSTHHGGARISSAKRCSKHVTAVICVPASEEKFHQFSLWPRRT